MPGEHGAGVLLAAPARGGEAGPSPGGTRGSWVVIPRTISAVRSSDWSSSTTTSRSTPSLARAASTAAADRPLLVACRDQDRDRRVRPRGRRRWRGEEPRLRRKTSAGRSAQRRRRPRRREALKAAPRSRAGPEALALEAGLQPAPGVVDPAHPGAPRRARTSKRAGRWRATRRARASWADSSRSSRTVVQSLAGPCRHPRPGSLHRSGRGPRRTSPPRTDTRSPAAGAWPARTGRPDGRAQSGAGPAARAGR